MIGKLSQDEFATILHSQVSPINPIQSGEHLRGRSKQLRIIEQALTAKGRSVFIYGDRGVGKTSLAQTAAFSLHDGSGEPLLLACVPETSFIGVMRFVVEKLRKSSEPKQHTVSQKAKFHAGIASYEVGKTTHSKEVPVGQIDDLNSIMAALLDLAAGAAKDSVIIVDEFDRLASEQERTHFADFIKQVGDQRLAMRFIFCGVAETLESLLGAHESCFRYIQEVELSPLGWEARWEIIDTASKALGVRVVDHPRMRIAAISDGFPHYIHLVCERLFWHMFDDPKAVSEPTIDHYRAAVGDAVSGIEQRLRIAYDRATLKDADGYQQALWAMADHADTIRNTEAIYGSYLKVMAAYEEAPLDRDVLVSRLQSLKSSACGRILTSPKKGWYQFSESIMRGYVRLRAEDVGLELALDYAAGTSSSSATWKPVGARKSRGGPTRADWKRTTDPSGYR